MSLQILSDKNLEDILFSNGIQQTKSLLFALCLLELISKVQYVTRIWGKLIYTWAPALWP